MGPLPIFDLGITSVLKTKLNDPTVELNPNVERKSLHQYSLFFFLYRQAPGQIVTFHTACLGVAWTWWRTTCSTEQALQGSLLLAPLGGRDHTFLGNFRCSGEHRHWLIIHGKSHAHTLLQLVQSRVDFYWVVDKEDSEHRLPFFAC